MNKVLDAAAISVLFVSVLACGLGSKIGDKVTGGDKLVRTDSLWSDVPQMDGITPSDMELPFTVKLLVRTALNNMWRFNKKDEDRTPASGDWAAYQTDSSPSDVEGYYTTSRMTSFGQWDTTKDGKSCINGQQSGVPGIICAFKKKIGEDDIGLAIIATPGDKKTNVFFIRIDVPPDERKK